MSVTNIGIFGRRNAGKSSLINTLLGQDFAIVSDKPGTTTDPVKKRIEIFGLGPCQFIDTAGIDDSGELGGKRVEKTKDIVSQVDIAILLYTANDFGKYEKEMLKDLRKYDIPTILVHNQSDIVPMEETLAVELTIKYHIDVIEFSCCILDAEEQQKNIRMLTDVIIKASKSCAYHENEIFHGLISEGQKVLLVCPQDSEAPTGRLILPQVMAIRDLLDRKAVATVIVPESLSAVIKDSSYTPDLVVTDSQVFGEVASVVPQKYPLTSFSMLLARSKGCYQDYLAGTRQIANLVDGDRVLILESCSHHASCEDIGRVKLPALIRKVTGKNLEFDIIPGLDPIKRNINEYSLVIQCGGCMITSRQLHSRLLPAIESCIPVSNYGMAIAFLTGIFDRAVKPLSPKNK